MRSIVIVAAAGLLLCRAHGQVALTPDTPAISPSSVFVPGGPALTAPVNSNVVATNATPLALANSLSALQTNLQQTLPILILFNNNFDFVSLGDNGVPATTTANPPGNFSSNDATNFAQNLAVNTAVPTGPPLITSVPTTAGVRVPAADAGLPQGMANTPVSRDTIRALLVLQSDIQRMLPVINALNNGTTVAPGSFTNLFGVVPAAQ